MAEALFALGCFWRPEVTFRKESGVRDVMVGYAGGHTASPSYEAVCRGTTGHAEAVRVKFDPEQISFTDLLDVFFGAHDATIVHAEGDQYRSAIFPRDAQQHAEAEAAIAARNEASQPRRAIETRIEPDAVFWPAEDYHQRYLEKRGAASR